MASVEVETLDPLSSVVREIPPREIHPRDLHLRTAGRRPEPSLLVGGVLGLILVLFLALPVAALVVRAILGEPLAEVLGQRAILDALVLSLGTTAASESVC